jgi:3-hydroxyisobutyrate dehydrogenase-like beta-hydroxyacid dehydrogenase
MTHPKWALPLAGRLVLTGVTAVWVTGVLSFLIAAGSPLVSAWQAAKLQRIAKDEFSAQFALSLALKDVHIAWQAAGEDRFAAVACLADEWQQVVDQGLGGRDLTVVTLALQ